MNVIYMVMFAIYAAGIVFLIVSAAVSRVKAKRIGIIRVKFPTTTASLWVYVFATAVSLCICIQSAVSYRENNDYINDMKTRGITAVAEHEHTTPDELLSGVTFIGENSYAEIYVERETARYLKQVDVAQRNIIIYGMMSFAYPLLFCLGCGAYITKNGVIFFTSFKPQKTSAKIKKGNICFYTEKYPEKAVIKFPASEDNKEMFKGFIIPEEPQATEV